MKSSETNKEKDSNSKEVKNEPQNIDKLTEKETLLSNETIEKLCNRGEKYKELLTIIDNTISIEVSQEKVKKKTFFETSLNPKFKNDKLNKIFKDFINNSVNKFSLTKNEKFKKEKIPNKKPIPERINPIKTMRLNEFLSLKSFSGPTHKQAQKPGSLMINSWIGKEKLEQGGSYFHLKKNEIKNLVTFTNNLELKMLNKENSRNAKQSFRKTNQMNNSGRITNPLYLNELDYFSHRLDRVNQIHDQKKQLTYTSIRLNNYGKIKKWYH